jgi:hypothetical protein
MHPSLWRGSSSVSGVGVQEDGKEQNMFMRKVLGVCIFSIVFLLAGTAGTAFAATNGAANRTDHFGPFAVRGPDIGSCGNFWATDTFTAFISVHANGNGTFTYHEVDHGIFTTRGPVSPGACEKTSHHGSTVRAGIVGSYYANLVDTATSSQYHPNACKGHPSPCTYDNFIQLVFGPSPSFTIKLLVAVYISTNPSLEYQTWINNIGNGLKPYEGDIANE